MNNKFTAISRQRYPGDRIWKNEDKPEKETKNSPSKNKDGNVNKSKNLNN